MAAKRAEIDTWRRYVDHQFAVVNPSAEAGNVVRGGGQGNFDLKGTVSQTAHVQVINQKWSDVFKFVICETKWRQQAEYNPHSHGGRRNNSGRK